MIEKSKFALEMKFSYGTGCFLDSGTTGFLAALTMHKK